MENVDKRVDIKLACNEEDATQLVAKPNYDRTTIFDDEARGKQIVEFIGLRAKLYSYKINDDTHCHLHLCHHQSLLLFFTLDLKHISFPP